MVTGRRRLRVWDHPLLAGAMIAVVAAAAAWENTDFQAPPRFDGAGYSVLARALASGRGYREIDHPDAPRHAHFPPGYPAVLAATWRATGSPLAPAAHGLSLACIVAATLTAWRWFGTMYSPRVAGRLALALAVNWSWNRTGGSIQSEPLFLLLGSLALLVANWAGRRGGVISGVTLGATLGACTLTRHVGIALAAALMFHLLLNRRLSTTLAAGLIYVGMLIPWVAWLAIVRENTQVALLARESLPALFASQVVFYVQRLPDQLTGPVVEIGTVFQRRASIMIAVNVWAVLATALICLGWTWSFRTPRRRLAGLTAIFNLGLFLVWPFTEAGRFLIPLVPCLMVGVVEGLAALGRRGFPQPRRSTMAAAILAISLPYSAYALATGRAEAQRQTHADFDAACDWIARKATAPGPILTRHPGEVYWQTGRNAVAPASEAAVLDAIEHWRVAYLLVDDKRYANAPANPLSSFARDNPARVREVWSRDAAHSSVRVYQVLNRPALRTGGDRNPRNGGSSGGGTVPSS